MKNNTKNAGRNKTRIHGDLYSATQEFFMISAREDAERWRKLEEEEHLRRVEALREPMHKFTMREIVKLAGIRYQYFLDSCKFCREYKLPEENCPDREEQHFYRTHRKLLEDLIKSHNHDTKLVMFHSLMLHTNIRRDGKSLTGEQLRHMISLDMPRVDKSHSKVCVKVRKNLEKVARVKLPHPRYCKCKPCRASRDKMTLEELKLLKQKKR